MIFDHDETLVDSETITLTLIATMAVELGAEVYPDDAERFVGADIHLALDEIEKRIGQPLNKDAFLEEFRLRQEREIRASLSEISGATKLLEALIHQEIPFAVASNAPVAKMEVCLEATDCFASCHMIVSSVPMKSTRAADPFAQHQPTLNSEEPI